MQNSSFGILTFLWALVRKFSMYWLCFFVLLAEKEHRSSKLADLLAALPSYGDQEALCTL